MDIDAAANPPTLRAGRTADAVAADLLDRYAGFVFDLDGTVYLGDALLPGADRVIPAIRRAGRPLLYLTNKPLETSAAYATKLTRMGLPTAPDEVLSSLDALVSYLRLAHPGARVLPVSEPLVATTLTRAGFRVLGPGEASTAQVVAVSFDRTFDYAKLTAAFRAVRSGAVIVATNSDRYCPTPHGGLPDCAAMLAAIEACTGATAEAVVGKPSSQMARAILDRLDLPAERVLLLGDRLETDIAMARAAGMGAALVLTGVTDLAAARAAQPAPTHVLDALTDLVPSPRRSG
jgi:HAD superfamily hydrolase (TIGR01450 family)